MPSFSRQPQSWVQLLMCPPGQNHGLQHQDLYLGLTPDVSPGQNWSLHHQHKGGGNSQPGKGSLAFTCTGTDGESYASFPGLVAAAGSLSQAQGVTTGMLHSLSPCLQHDLGHAVLPGKAGTCSRGINKRMFGFGMGMS